MESRVYNLMISGSYYIGVILGLNWGYIRVILGSYWGNIGIMVSQEGVGHVVFSL